VYVYAIVSVVCFGSLLLSYGCILFGFSAKVAQAALVEHGWDVGQAANSLLG